MFAAMLHPTVYIAAGLGLGVLLLVLSYWRQSRQIRRQLQDLQDARQELKSINASNIGLGRRIKSLESKRGPTLASVSNITEINDMAGASPQEAMHPHQQGQFDTPADSMSPDTIVAKDLRELQAQQQSLLASLTALENEQQHQSGETAFAETTQEPIVGAAFQSQQPFQTPAEESRAEPSFQQSLAAHLEQEAVSEQHFKTQNSEPEAQEEARHEPYSYDDEPEPDLAQTPYTRASAMLDEGLALDEIERQSGLSKAEIKLMATMHKNMSKFALA
ncbi:DUF2802 domain-containing protein [Pseudoteredinibacter isoporae]|uniref:DUF2802 domain-containing protein n=1 Tax=Pseudoteredinibacter isoporae TaxID=570281 RepID=A0A7X0JY84_9GAMM|nr:DUF2802 domain-containing protein [Pseudoteredinibacter isoporae]MBB6523446.1 hypothetical protein [Pseudoteredinibacter isoporae]NHO88955.1 DUF2802 domain-containing protein [Pseudoteredinibacter isoporae]NIB24337.1 DUF2802 domain-containing protein [Pseudoteredinibacter isoporae]